MKRNVFIKRVIQAGLFALLALIVFALKTGLPLAEIVLHALIPGDAPERMNASGFEFIAYERRK